jgi:hypothetical protein
VGSLSSDEAVADTSVGPTVYRGDDDEELVTGDSYVPGETLKVKKTHTLSINAFVCLASVRVPSLIVKSLVWRLNGGRSQCHRRPDWDCCRRQLI